MECPQLLTEAEVADWLGVPVEAVALWARDGRLLAAARTEGGQLLFYRWRVERDGAALAAFAPVQTRQSRSKLNSSPAARQLACGCKLIPPPGRLCRTGAALLATAALAEDFAASAPADEFLDRIASLCRDALVRHLAGPPLDRKALALPAAVAVASPLAERQPSQPAHPPANEGTCV
jgi:hypothetical protein